MGMGQLLAQGRCQQTSQTLGAGGDALRWSRALGPQEEKSFHDVPGKCDQMVVQSSTLDTKGPSSLLWTLFIFSLWATQGPSWYSSGDRGADGSLLAYPSALVCHFAPAGGRPQEQRTLPGLTSGSLLSPRAPGTQSSSKGHGSDQELRDWSLGLLRVLYAHELYLAPALPVGFPGADLRMYVA